MSLAEGILWFLSTFVCCWGATLIVRGLRGERIRKRWATTGVNTGEATGEGPTRGRARRWLRWRPTWRLMWLGVVAVAGGLACGWFGSRVHQELGNGSGGVTPLHMAAAGVGLFGVMLLTHSFIGDRSKGRKRCPRCWYDMSGAGLGEGDDGQAAGVVCPECGRAVKAARDLRRSRRSRVGMTAGVLAILLAGTGAWYLQTATVTRGLAGLTPGRVLVWLALRDPDQTDPWMKLELGTRLNNYRETGYDATAFSLVYLEAWADAAEHDDRAFRSEFLSQLAYRSSHHLGYEPSGHERVRELAVRVHALSVPRLREELCDPDPLTRGNAAARAPLLTGVGPEIARKMWYGLSQPKAGMAHDLQGELEAISGDPGFPEGFASALLSPDPVVAEACLSMLWDSTASLFLDELLARAQDLSFRSRGEAQYVLGYAALTDLTVSDRVVELLGSASPAEVKLALSVLQFTFTITEHVLWPPSRSHFDREAWLASHPGIEETIAALLEHSDPRLQRLAVSLLVEINPHREGIVDELVRVSIGTGGLAPGFQAPKLDFADWLAGARRLAADPLVSLQWGLLNSLPDLDPRKPDRSSLDPGTPEERVRGLREVLALLGLSEDQDVLTGAAWRLKIINADVSDREAAAALEGSG